MFALCAATLVATLFGNVQEGNTFGDSPRTVATSPAKVTVGSDLWGPSPYCGIYAAWAFFKTNGKETDLSSLLTRKYLSTPNGSTARDLERLFRDHGCYAVTLKGMTTRFLRNSPYPAILHVKEIADGTSVGHYLLLAKYEHGTALVLDPPWEMRRMTLGELSALWSGTGIIVSTEPIDVARLQRRDRLLSLTPMLALAVGIAAVKSIQVRLKRSSRRNVAAARIPIPLAELFYIGLITCALALPYHAISVDGLLAAGNGAKAVEQDHAMDFLKRISTDEVRSLLMDTDTAVVDARMARDFVAGHLPRAYNLPPNADSDAYADFLKNKHKAQEIIVYCQSATCPYTRRAARALYEKGFTNLLYFRGGWREWETAVEE
jgi:rhodanese-related sulfurtransferase